MLAGISLRGSRGSRDAVGVEPNARRRRKGLCSEDRPVGHGWDPSVIAARTFVRPCRGVFVVVATPR